MPMTPLHTLFWQEDQSRYELYTEQQLAQAFEPEDCGVWLIWLDHATAFAFRGACGSLNVYLEARKRGGRYWYAYHTNGKHTRKRYLGRTPQVTFARLEEAAHALHQNSSSPSPGSQSHQQPGLAFDGVGSAPASEAEQGMVLLATKFAPPRLPSLLVGRDRLLTRLDAARSHRLTLLSAPAGYGKTTLLAQWLAESAIPVAWLALDGLDNDPVRFLTYLLAAMQTYASDLDINILALLEAPQTAPLEKALAVLIHSLMSQRTGDFALVLDDYQVIEASPIHHALAFLLDHLPPHLHLVLSTRADPPLPLARLRARRQLTELRAADLRLSQSESEIFLQTVMGLDLPPEALLAIERRTEGWIAGLQLAALSLRGRDDVSTWLSAFTGSHRFVLDYLSEEVLSQLPAPVLSFLLHTSILERLSGSLCDAVTEQEDSQAMLETLERANLFVVPLDDERCWYRYHHLFAQLLQSRLQRTQPALVAPLHQRASLWYEQHDQPVEAVQHALAARAVEQAVRLIERYAPGVLAQGRTRLLLDWFNALPEALVHAHPWLSIYHASALHLLDQLEETETRILDAERTLSTRTAIEQAIIRGLATAIRANLARYSGDLEQALTLAREALNLLPEMPQTLTLRATAMVMVAHTYLVSGEVTANTEQQVQAAVAAARASGYQLVHFRSLTLLARLQVLQGRLRKASATYEQAGQATPGEVLQVLSASAVYSFALGDLLREWNRLDEAEHLLVLGIEQISGKGAAYGDDLLLGYIALIRLYQARGMYSQAIATLNAFLSLAETRHFPLSTRAIGDAIRAHIALAQGRLPAAISWADASGLSCHDAEVSYRHEQEYLILARVRIAQGREDTANPWLQETLSMLKRLLQEAETKARIRSVLEILSLLALTLDAQGKQDEASSTLHEALRRAEPEGYIRLFVDEGASMQLLLQKIQERGILPDYVATLLCAFQHPLDAVPTLSVSHELVELLTQREREVLHLLSGGASNREIARRLIVSVNTVKRHVYNLCSKLGVQSRTQAIARARSLHLL